MRKRGKSRRGHGEGSITFNRRKRLWQASIQTGLDDKGKPRRRYVRAKSKSIVLDKLRDLQSKRVAGRPEFDSRVTLGPFMTTWLENTVRQHVRFGTYTNYKGLLSNKINPRIGGYRLIDITPRIVQQLQSDLANAGNSPYRGQQVRSMLFAAFRYAVEQEMIPSNPCAAVRTPRLPSKEMHILTDVQAAKLLETARKDRFYALYVTALGIGLREGELFGLRWADISFEAGTISVQRTVVSGEKAIDGTTTVQRPTTNEPKTKKGRRLITVPATVIDALREHKEKMFAEGHFEWVFCDNVGGLLRRSNFRRRLWKPLLVRVDRGLPEDQKLPTRFRFHDLRHTAASLRLANGDHPKVVQELLGHARIAITLDLYSHVMPSLQRESAERMDLVLAKLAKPQ